MKVTTTGLDTAKKVFHLVELANKLVRIAGVIVSRGESYCPQLV